MWPRQLLVVLGLVNVAGSDVVERPTHQVVRVGQDVRFHCRSDNVKDVLRWDYMTPSNSQHIQVYNGQKIHQNFGTRHSVSNLTGTHRDLDIRRVQSSDAGTYVCFNVGENRSFAAALVVLESEPKCHELSTLDPNGVMHSEVECKVSYAGDWPPSFQCLPPATDPNDSSTVRVPSHSVTYRQRIVTGRGKTWNCWMHFDYNHLTYLATLHHKYDRKPVAYMWTSSPIAPAGTSTPSWVVVVAVIATIIGGIQLFWLARFCSRKFKPKFGVWRKRLEMLVPRIQAAETSAAVGKTVNISGVVQSKCCSENATKDPNEKCEEYEELHENVDTVPIPIPAAMYARIIQQGAHATSRVATASANENEYIELLDVYK